MFRVSFISCAAFILAFLLAAMMINHGLMNSRLPAGPGLTLDESFNIDQGVYLVDALGQHGPLLFTPKVTKDVFGSRRYLPDHPPLGRMLLGMSHALTGWLIPGSEATSYNVPAARLGSCFAFAMTALLLTEFALRTYGTTSGVATAIMLIGMPHLIGHARLAALESATNLAWVAAILPILAWWTSSKPPSTIQSIISGGIWGLVLLTKVQGIFLPPMIFLWAAWQFRWKAIRPLTWWGLAGALIFFSGWPWLWLDPVHNLMSYLGRTTDRPTLYCWYFGHRYADKAVPWHFPYVMTLISLPAWTIVGLTLRGINRRFDSAEQFLLLCIFFPLTVFAIPGVPVYDGTRLFLMVLPSIALLSARGFAMWSETASAPMAEQGRNVWSIALWLRVTVWSVLAISPAFWILQPLAISQYGLLTGGNRGAAWMGLEASYWSDALNGDFWKQVPENSTVFVAPVSHQFQLSDLEALVPIVQQRNIRLVAYKYDSQKQKGLLLLIHRLADLRVSLRSVPPGGREIARVAPDGVIMARLIDTSNATFPDPLQ